MLDWNQITRRLTGLLWTVGMCLRAWQPTVENLNASKIAPVSLSLKEVFPSRIFFPWWLEPLRKTIFATNCLRTALSCTEVVSHFIYIHYVIYYIPTNVTSIFATTGMKRNRPFTRPISRVAKNGLGASLLYMVTSTRLLVHAVEKHLGWLTINDHSDSTKFCPIVNCSARYLRIINSHHTLITSTGITYAVNSEGEVVMELISLHQRTLIWVGNLGNTIPPTDTIVLAQSSRHYTAINGGWLPRLKDIE